MGREIILDGTKFKYHELESKQNLIVCIQPYAGYWFLISYVGGGDVYRSEKGVTFQVAVVELNNWLEENYD